MTRQTTCLACSHPVHDDGQCGRTLGDGTKCACKRKKRTKYAEGDRRASRRSFLGGGCGCLGDTLDAAFALSFVM